jgi:hypothetical protein
MMLDPSFIVRIERPDTALANALNEMRTWLDNTRLQPVEFKIAIAGVSGIAFDVTFHSEADACQFEQAFTKAWSHDRSPPDGFGQGRR